jgi:hypothetical protein
VKRRGEKMVATREGTDPRPSTHKRKDRDDDDEEAGGKKDGEHEKSTKRGKERRDRSKGKALREEAAKSALAPVESKTEEKEKRGIEKDQSIGSLIGRKRRRKAGK